MSDEETQSTDLMVVYGDSIAHGLGANGNSYPVLLARILGMGLLDCTRSAMQLREACKLSHEAGRARLALIAFGITEAMVRPAKRSLRLMPPRWRRPGWMDPRPYYSRRRWKRVAQRVESTLRWRSKVALIRLLANERWGSPQQYECDLLQMIDDLKRLGVVHVVLIGHMGHDERFFPGSAGSCDEFQVVNRSVADRTGSLYLDGAGLCRRWEDFLLDHFHPNEQGHKRIADALAVMLQQEGIASGADSLSSLPPRR